MSKGRRPSLLGALLWIGLGLLFLLRNFGIGPDFWTLAGRYWPVLLILLGLGKVLEYFLRKEAVSIRFGEIIGILFLLLIGAFFTKISDSRMSNFLRDLPIEIGGTPIRPGQWMGESHAFTEEISVPLQNSIPIRIENSYGSVSVSPGSDREIIIRLRKVVYGTESRAKEVADQIHIQTAQQGKNDPQARPTAEAEPGKTPDAVFVVSTNREALSSKDYRFNTDMEILVPKNTQLQVKNAFGDIRVAEIKGKLDLSTTHRSLEVQNCVGEFVIATRYGECRLNDLVGNLTLDGRGKVYIDNIKGDVSVTNEYSPLEILNVDGKLAVSSTEGSLRIEKISNPVTINARGTQVRAEKLQSTLRVVTSHKNVDITDVESDVSVESSYATIALKNIKGNAVISSNTDRISADDIRGQLKVTARGSSLRANGVKGPLDIQTTRKEVIVNDFEDACSVVNEYARVRLSTRKLGKGDVKVINHHGGIDLFLPEGAAFSIDASARNGKVQSSYAGLEAPGNSDTNGVLKSKMKTGGPRIAVETEYGNIRISRTRGNGGGQSTEDD
jgi:hypothetical protein